MVKNKMRKHVLSACSGLRAIGLRNYNPSSMLYVGPEERIPPLHLSDLPIILTPLYILVDIGAACDIWFVPCYMEMGQNHKFRDYITAYEDYFMNRESHE